jgi:hypothetical protein
MMAWRAAMANNDIVRQTLEYYRQQRDSKATEVARLNFMISQLEADLGESPSTPSSETALTGEIAAASRSFSPAAREPELRRDEFVGLTQVAAVKAYLNKIKRAVPLDQLAEAIKRGGATLGGAVPTKTLYVSLARNPNRDFVFLDDDYIGLREFYPSLPKASTARNANGKKTKPSRKAKTKTAAPKKTKALVSKQAPEKKGPPAAEIKKALSSILSSVAIPDVKGLTAAVQEKLGTPVHHLSVFRALQDDTLFEKTEKGFKSRHSAA